MSRKTLIFIFLSVFSFIGGLIPMLWGDSGLGLSSVIFSALGGFFGIYLGFKMGE